MSKSTPAMQQYWEFKEKYSDGFLFFQMGDFFELFGEDAVKVGKLLDLTVTSRDKNSEKPLPMAGVPLRAKEKYIVKLLDLGHKVVVCEQIGKPVPGKVVERKITEVLSPGMVVDADFINEDSEELALAITYQDEVWYCSCVDVSIGEVRIFSAETESKLQRFFTSLSPRVVISTKNIFIPEFVQKGDFILEYKDSINDISNFVESKHPIHDSLRKIDTKSKESVYLLLNHINDCHFEVPTNISKVTEFRIQSFKISDKTFEHLEIFHNSKDHSENKSLYQFLNKTKTSQGARLLKSVMKNPLSDLDEIQNRQQFIKKFVDNSNLRKEVQEELKNCRDLDRIASRVSKNKARPQDLKALLQTLENYDKIKINS